jgi:hypothetical protein
MLRSEAYDLFIIRWLLLISRGNSGLVNRISKLLPEIVLPCRLTVLRHAGIPVAVGNIK